MQQEKQNAQTVGAKPSSGTTAAETAAKDLPAATNQKYAEALAKFREASELQPSSVLFANNAGFAGFKLGQYEKGFRKPPQWIRIAPLLI